MRNEFPGWYPKTEEQLSVIWENAIFVPDTNILLHCLRHDAQTRESLLKFFEKVGDSLWIPYQVGLEFHRNRLEVESTAQQAYDSLVKECETAIGGMLDTLRLLKRHPSIGVTTESDRLKTFLDDFRERMREAKERHPTEDIGDAVERLSTLLAGRVGAPWSEQQLAAVRKEGEDRYSKKIPPGYRDKNKEGVDKYGDLIIWKDLIAKAKAEKRPLVLITDDLKEDWWWEHRRQKKGVRPELVEEFLREAGQDFHIYQLVQFLHIASERGADISKENVEHIEASIQDDEQTRQWVEQTEGNEETRSRIMQAEVERDQIISLLVGVPMAGSNIVAGEEKEALRLKLRQLDSLLVQLRQSLEESRLTAAE